MSFLLSSFLSNLLSVIHFLVAAGIRPNSGQNPTWSLLRQKIGNQWDNFITPQLATKCKIPDVSEYDNRPMYPHEISLNLLDFAFLSERLGINIILYLLYA